jgi:hypothetical protein
VRQDGTKPLQVDRLVQMANQYNVKLIVLSIGGNDLEFSDIVQQCVFDYVSSRVDDPDHCAPRSDALSSDPAYKVTTRLDPTNTYDDNVVHRVEKTIRQIRIAMESPRNQGGAGYAPSQYRILLQSYPSPIPRGSEFSYAEALPSTISVPLAVTGPVGAALATVVSNGRVLLGCPFWNSDATWARDTLVPLLSDALAGVATREGVGFLDLRDFLQNREVCSDFAENEGFFGSPSGASAEWARSIYLSAGEGPAAAAYDTYAFPTDLIQGDAKEPIHPNAYAQRGLQRCLLGAYSVLWDGNTPTAHLKCTNNPGGPANVTTTVIP